MRIEIDQSWKIEKFDKATIIAFSNGTKGSVRISQRAKREAFALLESHYGKSTLNIFRIFAAVITLLLEKYKLQPNRIVIDEEYSGNGDLIIKYIKSSLSDEIDIVSGNIGKSSRAHVEAYEVFKKKRPAGFNILESEILKFLRDKYLRNKK
ncbi:MAG: hypothetical protein NT141_01550 [candidate division WWE3 bacterium]|nr:hypothetical protein [candidate division WWE3 bacterium]